MLHITGIGEKKKKQLTENTALGNTVLDLSKATEVIISGNALRPAR